MELHRSHAAVTAHCYATTPTARHSNEANSASDRLAKNPAHHSDQRAASVTPLALLQNAHARCIVGSPQPRSVRVRVGRERARRRIARTRCCRRLTQTDPAARRVRAVVCAVVVPRSQPGACAMELAASAVAPGGFILQAGLVVRMAHTESEAAVPVLNFCVDAAAGARRCRRGRRGSGAGVRQE